MLIATFRVLDMDRVGMLVTVRMRRSFTHAAVRQHENTDQQHDDDAAHAGSLTPWHRAGNVASIS